MVLPILHLLLALLFEHSGGKFKNPTAIENHFSNDRLMEGQNATQEPIMILQLNNISTLESSVLDPRFKSENVTDALLDKANIALKGNSSAQIGSKSTALSVYKVFFPWEEATRNGGVQEMNKEFHPIIQKFNMILKSNSRLPKSKTENLILKTGVYEELPTGVVDGEKENSNPQIGRKYRYENVTVVPESRVNRSTGVQQIHKKLHSIMPELNRAMQLYNLSHKPKSPRLEICVGEDLVERGKDIDRNLISESDRKCRVARICLKPKFDDQSHKHKPDRSDEAKDTDSANYEVSNSTGNITTSYFQVENATGQNQKEMLNKVDLLQPKENEKEAALHKMKSKGFNLKDFVQMLLLYFESGNPTNLAHYLTDLNAERDDKTELKKRTSPISDVKNRKDFLALIKNSMTDLLALIKNFMADLFALIKNSVTELPATIKTAAQLLKMGKLNTRSMKEFSIWVLEFPKIISSAYSIFKRFFSLCGKLITSSITEPLYLNLSYMEFGLLCSAVVLVVRFGERIYRA